MLQARAVKSGVATGVNSAATMRRPQIAQGTRTGLPLIGQLQTLSLASGSEPHRARRRSVPSERTPRSERQVFLFCSGKAGFQPWRSSDRHAGEISRAGQLAGEEPAHWGATYGCSNGNCWLRVLLPGSALVEEEAAAPRTDLAADTVQGAIARVAGCSSSRLHMNSTT